MDRRGHQRLPNHRHAPHPARNPRSTPLIPALPRLALATNLLVLLFPGCVGLSRLRQTHANQPRRLRHSDAHAERSDGGYRRIVTRIRWKTSLRRLLGAREVLAESHQADHPSRRRARKHLQTLKQTNRSRHRKAGAEYPQQLARSSKLRQTEQPSADATLVPFESLLQVRCLPIGRAPLTNSLPAPS